MSSNNFNELEVADFIAANYPFKAKSVTASHKTDSSKVFIIETDSKLKLIFKASLWYQGFAKEPLAALETAYQVAELLGERGLSVQTAYKNNHGAYVSTWEGLPWVLLSFISGSKFSGREEEFVAAGRALGEFHKIGSACLKDFPDLAQRITSMIPVEKPYEESRDLYCEGNLREIILSEHVCGQKLVCDRLASKITVLDGAIDFIDDEFGQSVELTKSILHNDFNYANGLYVSSGSFAGFIDADQLGSGPCVLDLGNTLASFATEFLKTGTQDDFEKRTGKFLVAYHSVWPLVADEYLLILAATQKWDAMRILRIMRRHHFESDRLSSMLPKISERFLPRLENSPRIFNFITKTWLSKIGVI